MYWKIINIWIQFLRLNMYIHWMNTKTNFKMYYYISVMNMLWCRLLEESELHHCLPPVVLWLIGADLTSVPLVITAVATMCNGYCHHMIRCS
jgi:hypothetical protein